jgi:hypothetical protein
MNLLQFIKKFPNEQSCKTYFIKSRIQQRIECKKCSTIEHYWLKSKCQFQCKRIELEGESMWKKMPEKTENIY